MVSGDEARNRIEREYYHYKASGDFAKLAQEWDELDLQEKQIEQNEKN